MTVVETIVEHARRLYWDDLRHGRYTYAVTGAARLVMIESGVTPTLKDKQEAEGMLRKGNYAHRHHQVSEHGGSENALELQTERTGNPDE